MVAFFKERLERIAPLALLKKRLSEEQRHKKGEKLGFFPANRSFFESYLLESQTNH